MDFCSWLTSVPQLGVTVVSGRFVHTSSKSATNGVGPADGGDTPRDDQEVSGVRVGGLVGKWCDGVSRKLWFLLWKLAVLHAAVVWSVEACVEFYYTTLRKLLRYLHNVR